MAGILPCEALGRRLQVLRRRPLMMPPVFFLAALQQTSVTRSRNAYAHLLLPPPASGPRICVH